MTIKIWRIREIEAAVVVKENGIGLKVGRRCSERGQGAEAEEKSLVRSIC